MITFRLPEDMDKECISLCTKMNTLGDVQTYESCCGHLKECYMIFFKCHSFERLAKMHRCVNRNCSDGKWELLVDGNHVHPTHSFCLRSMEPFSSYEEMEESVQRLMDNIDRWENPAYNKYFGGDGNKNIVDGYLLDTDTECINGHFQLELIVGDKYEIHYGIHQGLFEYVGRVSKDDPINIHSRGSHLFRNLEKNEITFGYFGDTSPYEFTRIVNHCKDTNRLVGFNQKEI